MNDAQNLNLLQRFLLRPARVSAVPVGKEGDGLVLSPSEKRSCPSPCTGVLVTGRANRPKRDDLIVVILLNVALRGPGQVAGHQVVFRPKNHRVYGIVHQDGDGVTGFVLEFDHPDGLV